MVANMVPPETAILNTLPRGASLRKRTECIGFPRTTLFSPHTLYIIRAREGVMRLLLKSSFFAKKVLFVLAMSWKVRTFAPANEGHPPRAR